MAKNIFNSEHMHTLPWVNGTSADVASGQVVVVGNILAVALGDIADGATGEVGTNCGVTAPKVSAAVWNQGDSLTFDVSAGAFDDKAATPAAGDITIGASFACAAGLNTETTAPVWLTGTPGTIT